MEMMTMSSEKIAQVDAYTADTNNFLFVFAFGGKVKVAHTLIEKVQEAGLEASMEASMDVPGYLVQLNLQVKGSGVWAARPIQKAIGAWPFEIFHIVKPNGDRFVTDQNLLDGGAE